MRQGLTKLPMTVFKSLLLLAIHDYMITLLWFPKYSGLLYYPDHSFIFLNICVFMTIILGKHDSTEFFCEVEKSANMTPEVWIFLYSHRISLCKPRLALMSWFYFLRLTALVFWVLRLSVCTTTLNEILILLYRKYRK